MGRGWMGSAFGGWYYWEDSFGGVVVNMLYPILEVDSL